MERWKCSAATAVNIYINRVVHWWLLISLVDCRLCGILRDLRIKSRSSSRVLSQDRQRESWDLVTSDTHKRGRRIRLDITVYSYRETASSLDSKSKAFCPTRRCCRDNGARSGVEEKRREGFDDERQSSERQISNVTKIKAKSRDRRLAQGFVLRDQGRTRATSIFDLVLSFPGFRVPISSS